ncbi:MAG: endonuclease/exonuclease/phosphatase family protein [Acidobacteriota bacterium]
MGLLSSPAETFCSPRGASVLRAAGIAVLLSAALLPLAACRSATSGPRAPGAQSGLTAIPAIQGTGHRSPLAGKSVATSGVVTAIGDGRWYLQDLEGDGEPASSDALCVEAQAAAGLEVGLEVEVRGRVVEVARSEGELPVTCLAGEVEVTARGPAGRLPAAVRLGEGGRAIPTELADDDDLQVFDASLDGLDFFETLEGMRVEIADARVVGATGRRGDLAVVADDGAGATVLTARGGLLRREGDDNPEALQLASGFGGVEAPQVDLGHTLRRVEAVVDSERGGFVLRLTAAPEVEGEAVAEEHTELRRDERHWTIASFNVLNLAATDGAEKFSRLARLVVENLGSPDLLALQEIQDESGAIDDGVTAADGTYRRLIDAIERLGGPRYEVRQIDPLDGRDGGRPGSNIRLGFLFDPARVEAADSPARQGAPARDGWPVLGRDGDGGVRLVPSPARLFDEAFERDPERGWSGTRKPLVGHFRLGGRDVWVVNLHFRSKGGDDRVFGSIRPPRRRSEAQRTLQAAVTRRFVEEVLEAQPEAWIVVLGDMNEHVERPPMRVLAGSHLVNLTARLPAEERYSFVYRGGAQELDHILVSRALESAAAPEVDVVHACSDYSSARQASDHDPLVLRLRLPASAD